MTPEDGRHPSEHASTQLHVVGGPAAGTLLDVAEGLVLGRDSSGPGQLGGDPQLSRRHARLVDDGHGTLTVEDLGSTNGTFLNGQRLERTETVTAGSMLQVGQTTIEARRAREAHAAQPPQPQPPQPHVARPPAASADQPQARRRFPWKPLVALLIAGGALAVVLLVADTGTPPEQDPADVERVEEAVATYYREPRQACDQLTIQAVAATYGNLENCRRAFEDYESLEVSTEDVTIERRSADARVTTSDDRVDEVELAESPDGDWEIEEISSEGS